MSKITEVRMPQMGEGVFEATLTSWLVPEGSKINKDSPLLELSTDKVDTEITSPASGFLVKVIIPVGTVVKVDQVLAHIADSVDAKLEAPSASPSAPAESSAPSALDAAPLTPPAAAHQAQDGEPLRSSPLVRKIAKDQGIDLYQVKGSGLHGRITKQDVLAFQENQGSGALSGSSAHQALSLAPSAPASSALKLNVNAEGSETLDGVAFRREKMSRMRQLIADHMVESVRTSPHVTTVFEIDLHKVWAIREQHKNEFFKTEGFKLTLTPFFIHAAVQAIKKFPIVNTSVDGYDVLWKKDINVGCAVALDNGLIVPVIKQAGDLSLSGIARRLNELVVKARSKKLKPEDVQGGTFSITNPGGWGSITSNPIINQPQVAILGIGAAVRRPVVVDDMIAIRPMMLMSLTFDHRVIDGEGGSKYLACLKQIIENYEDLPV